MVSRDVGLVERGKEVRQLGCNFVVLDMFDAGLLGDHVGQLLAMASRNVLQPGATVVPAAATVYCMGVEVLTPDVRGFDFKPFNKSRHATLACATQTQLPRAFTSCLSRALLIGGTARTRMCAWTASRTGA